MERKFFVSLGLIVVVLMLFCGGASASSFGDDYLEFYKANGDAPEKLSFGFDLCNANGPFWITAPNGYALKQDVMESELDDDFVFELIFLTDALLGSDDQITFSIVGGDLFAVDGSELAAANSNGLFMYTYTFDAAEEGAFLSAGCWGYADFSLTGASLTQVAMRASAVPAPATLILLGTGLLGLLGFRKRIAA